MKYQVGDKVKIREDLKRNKIYGGLGFIDSMEKYIGKETIITEVCYGGDYRINLDGGSCMWSDGMLNDVDIKEVKTKLDKSELDKYKELTKLLLGEIKLIDRTRYEDVKHFITELRSDLSELVV